jgi:ubiquinone/menaquinone biosynthesis C-methylase UbiE
VEDYLTLTIETYNNTALKYVHLTHDRRPQREFNDFCQSVASGGLVLDAGCAGGRDCQALVERGFRVVGVDLSEKMLQIAQTAVQNGNFKQADLRKIPLDDGTVDGVWCCASLLHLKHSEVPTALTEFRRVLKKDAVCCILVKEGSGEEFVQDDLAQGLRRFYSYFREDELCHLCLSLNFSILSRHTTPERGNQLPGKRDHRWICLLIRKT